MDYIELIKQRRSIRRYKPDPVPDEHIQAVLEAARLAPSWGNRQCWRYIVVTDPDVKEKLSRANGKWISDAPVIIVVCADPNASGHKPGMDYFMLDTGISFEHLVLAATNLGLGTCWIGAFDEKQAKDALGVPDGIRVVAFTPLGYPAEKKGQVSDRRPLQEIVCYEKYEYPETRGLKDSSISRIGRLYRKCLRFGERLRSRFAF